MASHQNEWEFNLLNTLPKSHVRNFLQLTPVGVDSSICLRESRRDPLHLHACLPVFSPFPAMASPGTPEPVIQGKFELWQQFSIKRIVEDVFRGDTMHRT